MATTKKRTRATPVSNKFVLIGVYSGNRKYLIGNGGKTLEEAQKAASSFFSQSHREYDKIEVYELRGVCEPESTPIKFTEAK